MNKRTFLKQSGSTAILTTTLGTSLTGIGKSLAAENAPATRVGSNRGMIYKAVKTNGKLTAEQLARLKELGFDGVEGVSPGIADKTAYMDMIRASGTPVHGVVDMVHWQKRLSSPDAAVRAAGQKALAQAVVDAKEFGASSVLLVPGKVAGPNETHDHVWQRSIAEIRKTIPLTSKLGIQILIENVWNGFCETPELLCRYIDEINSPWVGVYFDIGNAQKFAPAHEWIRQLGKRTVKLDVKDWGVKNGFCKLGEGDVDWPEVRKALKEIGFSGWATREGNDGGHEHTARLMNQLLDL
ncbi:MAG: sugar phosphate isomerase/epimerase family protein [Akkermansiaceae bacterium]